MAIDFPPIKDLLENFFLKFLKPLRPLSIQMDLLNTCNLDCLHCYHPNHKNDGALKVDDWILVLKSYKSLLSRLSYYPDIIICGGEPLLYPHLPSLLNFIALEFPKAPVSILTNGTIATRIDYLKWPRDLNYSFQISLDGPTAEIHDAYRGKGSFEKALQGFEHLVKLNFPVGLASVLSSKNAKEISSFFNLAKKIKATSMSFTRFIPLGVGKNSFLNGELSPLSAKEIKIAYREILENSAKFKVKSSVQQPLFNLIHPWIGRSGRFHEGLIVDFQGKILASSRSRLVLGHVFNEGLENIFLNHPIFRAILSGNVEGCGDCKYFRRCGGDRNAAYAATGNYLGKDPGCWLN